MLHVSGESTILLGICLVFCACSEPASERLSPSGPTPSDSGLVVVDAAGRSLRFDRPPARVLSLVPSATAILVSLGVSDVLVGRTDFDTTTALRDLPSVGGGLQPDLERLVTLRPDLVIRFAGEQDTVTPRALAARVIPHLAVRPDRIEDVHAIVRQLGVVMGRVAKADSLIATLDRELAEVRRLVAARERVRVAYLLGGIPPWVAGPGTYVADLLEVAGAANAFADLDHLYAPVSLEELLMRDIDAFVVARGTVVSPRLRARAPVREVSPDIELPGLGLGQAARALAEVLHPAAFR